MTPTAGRARPKSASQVRVDAAEADGGQDLVDEAVLREQPGPHDARRDERDDLRQEEHRA